MEVTPKIRRTCGSSRQGTGQRSGQKTESQSRTCYFNGYGFLKHRFLPLMDGSHEELRDWRAVQQGFFQSLGYCAKLYGFPPVDTRGKVFPDNIRIAYQQAAEEVERRRPDLKLIIIQDEG